MGTYKLSARCFLTLVWIAGLAALGGVFAFPPLPGDRLPLGGVLAALSAAAIAGSRKVRLIRAPRFSEASSVSLGFLVVFFTLLAFGLRAAVLAALVSGLSSSLFPRRQPLHQLTFNAAALVAVTASSGWVYALLNAGAVERVHLHALLAPLAAAAVYFLLNTGLVAVIIALCSDRKVKTVWRQNFLWTAPSYLAAASVATFTQVLFRSDAAAMLLLAAPIGGFIFQFYKVAADRAEQQRRYIAELQAGRQAVADLYLSTVRSLATAIDSRDQHTHAHIQRVQRLAVALAEEMGVGENEREAVRTGALLHDIGKLGVPDYVLLKTGALSPEEFEKMKRHAIIGAAILEPVPFPWPVTDVVRHHHERWDGTGYPDNLRGEEIPVGARILSVADVYDALTSDRPYRSAWSHAKAVEHIRARAGAQFDPNVVAAFLCVLETNPFACTETQEAVVNADRPEARATRHIARTGSELWALYETAQVLNADLDTPDKLELLSARIAAVLPGAHCAFLLYNLNAASIRTSQEDQTAQAGELWVWTSGGGDGSILRGVHGLDPDSIPARVARTRKPYRGPFVEDGLAQAASRDAAPPMRSALIVPLTHLGEALGTINLTHPDADAFSADDEQLLQKIAEQVQSVLYHDMLFDRTKSAAMTDALTGLYNARYLAQAVEPLLGQAAHADKAPDFALLYLDLDNFKPINDNFGHETGNIVLQNIAALFQKELRPHDLVIRYGGDEFLIILPETTQESASRVAERIRHDIREYTVGPLPGSAHCVRLDVSIGMACFPADGKDLHALVTSADHRMYAEKTSRKDRAPARSAASAEESTGERHTTLLTVSAPAA